MSVDAEVYVQVRHSKSGRYIGNLSNGQYYNNTER